jgi:hypothetical protein
VCMSLLAKVCGGSAGDNGAALYILLTTVHTGLFALLWLPVSVLTRRRSAGLRCTAVIAVTVLDLGFWFGCTAWLFAEMARTGHWL